MPGRERDENSSRNVGTCTDNSLGPPGRGTRNRQGFNDSLDTAVTAELIKSLGRMIKLDSAPNACSPIH